jgi:hypothetical protein
MAAKQTFLVALCSPGSSQTVWEALGITLWVSRGQCHLPIFSVPLGSCLPLGTLSSFLPTLLVLGLPAPSPHRKLWIPPEPT